MKKLLIFCLLVLAPSFAKADLKIAVIDLGKTFDQYSVTQDARKKLNEKHDQYQKELQDMISDYNHMGEELEALIKASQDPTLSKDAQAAKAKAADDKKQEFLALKNKLEERKNELDKELNDEMLRRHKEILDQITQVVDGYAGPAGYDLVIDTSSVTPTSGVSIILYHSSKLIDITADIVKQLNAAAPAPTATASAPTGAAH
ncbi:MAG TPA: OmpH family outer membrane protein [Candidatus Methylacidiphilales bacterium]|nr:OmpH family outer membrane protein [Candidatus Methylacidiphilales bacterium]